MQSSFFSRYRLRDTLAKGVSLVVLLALLGGAATVVLTACNKTEQHEAAEETAAAVPENAGQGGTKAISNACLACPGSTNTILEFAKFVIDRANCIIPVCNSSWIRCDSVDVPVSYSTGTSSCTAYWTAVDGCTTTNPVGKIIARYNKASAEFTAYNADFPGSCAIQCGTGTLTTRILPVKVVSTSCIGSLSTITFRCYRYRCCVTIQ
jgi:hypothetical protein